MLPSYLDDIVAEGYVPEEEILSILNVPPGKMGRVIGRKGASIQSVKESCQYAFLLYILIQMSPMLLRR